MATKVARKRLSVLEMAEALGNVSEACRRSGMDRTSFYEWRRRFQTHGLGIAFRMGIWGVWAAMGMDWLGR